MFFHQIYAMFGIYYLFQENARLAAEEEQEKIQLEQLELKRLHNDRMARARVRHQHALQKEMLKHVSYLAFVYVMPFL